MPRWPAGYHRPAGSGPAWGGHARRPPLPPIERYTGKVTVPLFNATRQELVSLAGAATLQIGPQGLGTVWYVTMITGGTSSFPNDYVSSVSVYIGAQVQSNLLSGAIPPGSGQQWQIGQANLTMTPGDLLTAVWTQANPGDTATITVYGEADAAITF